MQRKQEIVVRSLDGLLQEGLEALHAKGTDRIPLVDGRVVGVVASPQLGNAEEMAFGMSVLPRGLRTPPHEHAAEELAIVLDGTGTIEINGVVVAVRRGSVVLKPPNSTHITAASMETDALAVLWIYAPAGSELRWLGGPEDASGS